MAALAAPIEDTLETVETDFESDSRFIEPRAHILSVSEYQSDHSTLRRIVDDTQWRLTTAGSCRQAFEKLCESYPMVVFSESSLPDGDWKDILGTISRFNPPHSLLVVASRLADERLWSEVIHLGGYDVLTKPLMHDEVRRVLESIWTWRAPAVPHTRILRAGS
jgi:DNA-binding NtrC family response regulator